MEGEREVSGTGRVYSSGRSMMGSGVGSSREEMLMASSESSNWLEWIDSVAEEAGEAIVNDLPIFPIYNAILGKYIKICGRGFFFGMVKDEEK